MKVCTRYEMTWADAKFPILRLFNARSKPNICTYCDYRTRGSQGFRSLAKKCFKVVQEQQQLCEGIRE